MTDFFIDSFPGANDSLKYAAAHSAALARLPIEKPRLILPARKFEPVGKMQLRHGIDLVGDGHDIQLEYPGSAAVGGSSALGIEVVQPATAPANRYTRLEGFKISGRDTGYYRLVTAKDIPESLTDEPAFYSDIDFGVCGQTMLELTRVQEGLIKPRGRYGGDNSYDKVSAKYKLSLLNCHNLFVDDADMGDPAHDRNQSFLTVNSGSTGIRVRGGVFYGTRTYCVNTHGQQSHDVRFEGVLFLPGVNAHYAAVLVGSEYYGHDYDVHLLGCIMQGAGRFLQLRSKIGMPKSEVFLAGNEVPADMLAKDFITSLYGGGIAHQEF
jgi:hypothetical protein